MRTIKLFEEFQSKSEIDNICSKYDIKNYTINQDGTVDSNIHVYLNNKELTEIPIKFGKIKYEFAINDNFLTSLEGSPYECSGFYCYNNELTSFIGSPRIVYDCLSCGNNLIETFEGFPDYVEGDLYCDNNPIYHIWELFRDTSKIELFNYLDIIRDNKTIILQRLNEFLDMIGKSKVTEVKGYKCI